MMTVSEAIIILAQMLVPAENAYLRIIRQAENLAYDIHAPESDEIRVKRRAVRKAVKELHAVLRSAAMAHNGGIEPLSGGQDKDVNEDDPDGGG